jgi:hypothetical protein
MDIAHKAIKKKFRGRVLEVVGPVVAVAETVPSNSICPI